MSIPNKPMPIGVENFKKLRENYYFVDKTFFIRDLIDKHSDITLITRPRRFGKTLTMSMLKYFFTPEKAEDNRKLFAGLSIERAGEKYMAEQGTRPVISLSLKDATMRDFSSTIEIFGRIIGNLYDEHKYLIKDNHLEKWQKDHFKSIVSCNASPATLATSLKQLMIYMTQYWKKTPVLLLDEYDAPIIAAWTNDYYRECIDFMKILLTSALKTNDYLDFAVLTGITRVSKESIFSGLNNIDVCGVLSNNYADALGFTQDEVDELLTACGAENKSSQLKAWYDGYRFGQREIYNPWSVINFIHNNCEFGAYWINVSGNAILKELLQNVDMDRRRELEGLLRDEPVKVPIMENIVYTDLHNNRDALFMMLLTTGYLKAIDIYKDKRERKWAVMQIPNKEIKLAYEDDILLNVSPRYGLSLLDDMLNAMLRGDAEKFEDKLSLLLKDYVSIHDAARNPENFYHGLLLGLSVLLKDDYKIESNKESGYGRFDLAFFPLKKSEPGVIIEIKPAKKQENEKLEKIARVALEQIKKKEYATEFKKQGINNIWNYGVAFCGKRVVVYGESV